jgi:hypothetical protein
MKGETQSSQKYRVKEIQSSKDDGRRSVEIAAPLYKESFRLVSSPQIVF